MSPPPIAEAFASPEWRAAVARLASDFALVLDPTPAELREEVLGAAFAALSRVMLKMRDVSADARAAYFSAACLELGIDPPDEGQQVWLGLLTWAEAHPPRASLLARLQHAYVEAGRSWMHLDAPRLRPALMARARFYARQPQWRDAARQAIAGLSGDPRGHVVGEDLFLWMGGVVEWARQPLDRPGHLTTGEAREALLAALGIPASEESCLDGLLTAAGQLGPEPWEVRLVRLAGLVQVGADQLLELVRLRHALPDRAAAFARWTQEVGTLELTASRAWLQPALEAEAERIEALLDQRAAEILAAPQPEDAPFRVADHFGGSDVPYAWASLRDLAALRHPECEPPPAERAVEPFDPDPNVVAEAVTNTWHYGRRLVGRDQRMGYRLLATLVDANFAALSAGFLDLLTRVPPAQPEVVDLVAGVLTKEGRGPKVVETLSGPLSKQRHPGRWPALLEPVLARLSPAEIAHALPRIGAIVIERRGELAALLPGLARLFERAARPEAALDLCLRYFGPDGRGGADALALAVDAARAIDVWEQGGQRVLDAARHQGELVPELWLALLDLASGGGHLDEALMLVLSWASRITTPRGQEKAREKLAEEWNWALELAARLPGWDAGYGHVWAAAEECSCPVPAVWRALIHQAQAHDIHWIVYEGSKRFVKAWGADEAITRGLWERLEREVQAVEVDETRVVELLHWLHVDLGHNTWTTEEEFARRAVGLRGVTAHILCEWASRKQFSSRRWALLGAALARDPVGMDELLQMVCALGQPSSRALEGLLEGLAEERGWDLLMGMLTGPAAALEWAWGDAMRRWKLAPGHRAHVMLERLQSMPVPPGPVTPAFERECKLLAGYLMAGERTDRWGAIAAVFQRMAPGTATWNEMLVGVVHGPRGPALYDQMIAELLDAESVHGHARLLRERLSALATGRPEPELSVYVEGE